MTTDPLAQQAAHARGMGGRRVEQLPYTVKRLTVPVEDFVSFRDRYEAAAPTLPLDQVRGLLEQKAPWGDMEQVIDASAPHGFLIYFRNDVGPVMGLAGDRARCTAYLMGNHVIAERMYRYDPRAMMYAPLHTVIWEDLRKDVWFTVDQPSTQFSSFGIPEVSQVGFELDQKLAALLDALNVPVPAVLTRPA